MTTFSDWRTEYRCASCQEILAHYETFYSFGRCPKCSVKGENAGTIVDCVEIPYRLKYNHPSWMFWKTPERDYKP